MASRQNQLHAYQFAVQRTVSALVTREPDAGQAPFKRIGGSGFASLMITVLALAAVGVYGLVVAGGNKTWKANNTVVIERESGAKFIYLDNKLHPVLNYASALLIANKPDPNPVSVSRKSLAGAQRGTPLGIAGAPDSLVPRDQLLTGAWSVCTNLVRQSNGTLQPQSVLEVGARPQRARPVAETEAFFVRGAEGEFMVWNGRKYRVPDAERKIVHDALVVGADAVAPAAAAWLNVVPTGVELARPSVPAGGTSPIVGWKVGDVAAVEIAGGVTNHVVLPDGLAPLTLLQASLLASGQAPVRRADQVWFAGQPRSKRVFGGNGDAELPERPPAIGRPPGEERAACATFDDPSGVPSMLVDAEVPDTAGAAVTGSRSSSSTVLADRVVVEPGRGAVAEALASPDATSGTLCLVTDLGVVFPVPGADVLAILGYRSVTPVRLPSALLGLLPPGQALEPAAARAPAVVR